MLLGHGRGERPWLCPEQHSMGTMILCPLKDLTGFALLLFALSRICGCSKHHLTDAPAKILLSAVGELAHIPSSQLCSQQVRLNPEGSAGCTGSQFTPPPQGAKGGDSGQHRTLIHPGGCCQPWTRAGGARRSVPCQHSHWKDSLQGTRVTVPTATGASSEGGGLKRNNRL